MKILITGADGFIGKNLCSELKNRNLGDIFEYDKNKGTESLNSLTGQCDFVFHLAGVNRPQNADEYLENASFTMELIKSLKAQGNNAPILMTSSVQAEYDNAYGKSKKEAEKILLDYATETGSNVIIYRLPNVFGKWCRPNYNSVVATFCYNTARGLPVRINDPNTVVTLAYIDDVVTELIDILNDIEKKDAVFNSLKTTYSVTLRNLFDIISQFRQIREHISIPQISQSLINKLYSTYLSYLPEE